LHSFALLVSPFAHGGLGTAIEFYNAKNNHYFLTANPAEVAALDAGTTVKGWTRTGGQFTAFTEPAAGLAAVCRFFGTPGKGPDSHFYTADAAGVREGQDAAGVDVSRRSRSTSRCRPTANAVATGPCTAAITPTRSPTRTTASRWT
jgi:hypothetical protein